MTIQLGNVCAAVNVKGQTIIGAVVQIEENNPVAYKIEWCDGYCGWYNPIEAMAYVDKARRAIQ